MSELNILTTQNVSIKFRPAGVGDRIVATILDGIFLFVYIMIVIGLFIYFADSGDAAESNFNTYLFAILVIPIVFYHLLCEYFFNGQSLGKKILKLRVIKLDGTQPGISSYLLRWLLRLVDMQLFSGLIAVIAVVASENNQRLGDMAAGTTVIKEEEFVPLEYLRPVSEDPDHKVTFPEVERLNDRDIHTLKLVLQRWEESDNYEMVEQATAKVRQTLGITDTKGLSDIDFIKKVIADFSFLSHF